MSVRHDFEQTFFGLLFQVVGKEIILAAVARDAQLGQAQQADLLPPRVFDGVNDVSGIGFPRHRRLVQDGSGYFYSGHFYFSGEWRVASAAKGSTDSFSFQIGIG